MSLTVLSPTQFRLDRERFSKHLIDGHDERFGINSAHEEGFARAILDRFNDAGEAGAIHGPDDFEAMLYAPAIDSLLVAVRERTLPESLRWPLRQLASFSFETSEVAVFGDESFEECCAAIEELLDRANALLPSLAALREAESSRAA